MSVVDAVAEAVLGYLCPDMKRVGITLADMHDPSVYRGIAQVAIDVLRPTVSTVEQLDALPRNTLIRSDVGDYWERLTAKKWDCLSETGEGPTSPSSGIPLPALVLWRPDQAVNRG